MGRFLLGLAPIRRSREHLSQGAWRLRPQVQSLLFAYNVHNERSQGAYEFQFWHWAQLQYQNREVQMLKLREKLPNPYLQAFMEDGSEVLLDLDWHSKRDITDRVHRILCRSSVCDQLAAVQETEHANPANFGLDCKRQCICEVPGQMPCPKLVDAPRIMTSTLRWDKQAQQHIHDKQ